MARTEAFDNNSSLYDNWFIENKYAFLSELQAVKSIFPKNKDGIEIGIGSGIFAEPLNITEGIDPSAAMRQKAKQKGISVINAVAENLPYKTESKDFALMITSICFVDDINKSFNEAKRVLKNGGDLIIGFVDKDSPIGKLYLKYKSGSQFYKEATFYGTEELHELLTNNGFEVIETVQTIFGNLQDIKVEQETRKGYGKGSFVVIKAKKPF